MEKRGPIRILRGGRLELARVAAFGQDHDGELHVVTHEGPIFKLARR